MPKRYKPSEMKKHEFSDKLPEVGKTIRYFDNLSLNQVKECVK